MNGLSIALILITGLTKIHESKPSEIHLQALSRSTDFQWRSTIPLYAHGKHPPFLCPRAQVNEWSRSAKTGTRQSTRRAKQENRDADYRWGPMVTQGDVDGPDSTSQHQSEAPQPVCAAAAMMHGMPMAPASSVHGGCPSIAEHQEFAPQHATSTDDDDAA